MWLQDSDELEAHCLACCRYYHSNVCLCLHLDWRREVIFCLVPGLQKVVLVEALILPTVSRVVYGRVYMHVYLARVLFCSPYPTCYGSCSHCIPRRAIVINQACAMRWTGDELLVQLSKFMFCRQHLIVSWGHVFQEWKDMLHWSSKILSHPLSTVT